MPEPLENLAPAGNEVRWFARTGVWFWLLIALGAALRIYLLIFTRGTFDAGLWQLHAMGINELGLLDYYRSNPNANHPPLIFAFESVVYRFAVFSGIPFPVLLRAPFVCFDAGTTLLLLKLLGSNRWRFVLAAAYWINPLAILLSAYHGNTDSAIAFFILLSIWFLSKRQLVAGAIAMGCCLGIKLPGILAVPALMFYLRGWRKRLIFLSIVGAVSMLGYFLPAIGDPLVVVKNVLGYHGRMLQTQGGVPFWGSRVLFFSLIAPPEKWPEQFHGPVIFFLQHNWRIAVLLSFGLIFLRRDRTSVTDLCATIAMVYLMLAGLSDYWAFQYFAWSLPCWFFLRWWFFVPATLLTTAYMYSLNWTICGNPWLLGAWDFEAHPFWPEIVIVFRNLTVLFFFVAACGFSVAAVMDWFRLRRPTVDLVADESTVN